MKASLLEWAVLGVFALACNVTPAPLGQDAGTTSGAAGATGAAGTTGKGGASGVVAGTTGSSGTTGAAGVTGIAGTSGIAGVTGIAGNTGIAGTSGIAGNTGIAGVTGTAGVAGTSCGVATLPTGKCVVGAFARNGVCQCQTDNPCVCGNTCTDITSDDDNCGACGVHCGFTSTCQNGKCGPPPENLGPNLVTTPCATMNIALGGSNIYWTDMGNGIVGVILQPGGFAAIIASGEFSPTAVAVNGSTVFWLTARSIRRWNGAGTQPVTVTTSATDIRDFVVSPDGAFVYYSTGNYVMKVPAGGGAAAIAVTEAHGGIPTALAISGPLLAYPTDLNGDVDIAVLNPGSPTSCGSIDAVTGELLPNPGCNRVARSQGSLFMGKIVMTQTRVVWADGTNLKANDTMTGIQSNDSIAQTNGNDITGFTVTSGGKIYFADGTGFNSLGGVVYRAPFVRDATPVRLARGQVQPGSLVTDASRVYWTSNCAIMATGL